MEIDRIFGEFCAINPNTIEVTFSEAIDTAGVTNFSLSKGSVQTVGLSTDKTVATLGVTGLTYNDKVTVTVTNVVAGDSTLESYSEETRVPAFGEQYEVQIETGDDVILADGLSKTMVTARIMDTTTNEVVKKNGLVTFTTTKGDFAQPQVSFDQNGEAALQLTSEVSTSTITAFITATITNVPGATEYEGLVGQGQVRFAPEGEIDDELKMVSMVGASASQADRIKVVFSGPVTKADIVKGYATAAALADGYGFLVDGTRAVVNVRNVNEKTLELILDVDDITPTPELRWNSYDLTFEHYNHATYTNDYYSYNSN